MFFSAIRKDYLQNGPHLRIPSSCCSKYKNGKDAGQCTTDELESVKGCGDLLNDWYWKEDEDSYYSGLSFYQKLHFWYSKVYPYIHYTLTSLAVILTVTWISLIVRSRNAPKDSNPNFELSSSVGYH